MDPAQIQTLLKALAGDGWAVYFQPPGEHKMEYPCIRYQRDDMSTQFADNAPYRLRTRYSVTLMSRSPNTDVLKKLAQLPMSTYERFFVADNINHDVFNIYF
jgi:hypothetical protein